MFHQLVLIVSVVVKCFNTKFSNVSIEKKKLIIIKAELKSHNLLLNTSILICMRLYLLVDWSVGWSVGWERMNITKSEVFHI